MKPIQLLRIINFIILLSGSMLWTSLLIAQSPVVATTYGQIRGTQLNGIAVFKGIPFASPPVGNLRWKAPQPPKPWKGIKDCTQFSASPIQNEPKPFFCWSEEFIAPPRPLNEDCLYLNIWTNDSARKTKKPVFVWIYGGGFSSGSSACAVYDGTEYAKQGIVFVSINYRVGALGFMAHPELTQEGNGTSGNYGLMDQVAALQWVKKNISRFGGDPTQVTIAGQSAGSMSIHALIATPLAKGLFQRAIAQSGGLFGGIYFRNLKEGENQGNLLQRKLNAKSIAELRRLPADSILHVSSNIGGMNFAPILDGTFLPVDPAKAFRERKFNSVNLMTGWVTGDGNLMDTDHVNRETFMKTTHEQFGTNAENVLALLPHATDAEAVNSQIILNLTSFAAASAYRLAGFNAQMSYVYEFSHVPAAKPGFPNYGAFHTSEVPFALHNLHSWVRPWKELDRTIEQTMSSYWINFIKTGDPNDGILPKWEPFSLGRILTIGDVTESKNPIHKELTDLLYK